VYFRVSCKTSFVLPYVFILILFCVGKPELCTQEDMVNLLAPQDLLDQDLSVHLEQRKDGQVQGSHQVISELHKTQW
jgi:hypothetical protein